MADLQRIRDLVGTAIDEFDSPPTSTANTLRRCLRIAQLRSDFSSLFRLELESDDLTGEGSRAAARTKRRQDLGAHFDVEEWEIMCLSSVEDYFGRRALPEGHYGGSIETLESTIERFKNEISKSVPPEGLTPVDLYFRSKELDKLRLGLVAECAKFEHILIRVRAFLHQFLLDTEQALDYGQVNADIFERNRLFVDTQMATISPEALDQFRSAYKRIHEGDSESLSHALTSCRRILKSVADSVYPASDIPVQCSDGQMRTLDDPRYINRLIQLVVERVGKHGDGALVQAAVDSIDKRLKMLDGLASKGVHATATRDEVDACVIQTYLAIGDILRINAGRSGLTAAA